MKQTKKIFTRMCLNNWGGISHKILVFHEYVNLFSGKSGSGKSTVMDAIQVILYGSFSPNFLNKAADDAKNRRSVLSYLRGEQKDGTANREGQDFCSTIVLEIKDTGTNEFTCIGVAFEVHKNDTELKKYIFFSHAGKMPEDGYYTSEGYPYFNKDIRALVESRALSQEENQGENALLQSRRKEVNRVYPSREAYLSNLYDIILGYIDGNRFVTMEKSAIALRMTNGTGQFIRDYMFPRSTENAIEKISEQLGAYQSIKEQIDDVKRQIDMLTQIEDSWQNLTAVRTDMEHDRQLLCSVEIKSLEQLIENLKNDKALAEEQREAIEQESAQLQEARRKLNDAFVQAQVELQGSDLGEKEKWLDSLKEKRERQADDNAQWKKIVQGLCAWEEDEIVTDYIGNPTLNAIHALIEGDFTSEECAHLHQRLESEKENIEEICDDTIEEKKKVAKELSEKEKLVEDMNNNRKPYPEQLRQARTALERKLSDVYGRTIKVSVFADLFDVQDEEWKNAIEGRLGWIKLSLITEPRYAHDAAVYFRAMRQYEEINLINSAAIGQSNPKIVENSLYEAVHAQESYVDLCLRRYLGRIVKCHSIEELEKVPDGVTPDCCSYSNYMFRHLRKKDYTTYACIGSKVSKAKLKEYEEAIEKLRKTYEQLQHTEKHLKAALKFESLDEGYEHLARLAKAEKELTETTSEIKHMEQVIQEMKEGAFKVLGKRVETLRKELKEMDAQSQKLNAKHEEQVAWIFGRENEIKYKSADLEDRKLGYVFNEAIEEEARRCLDAQTITQIKTQIHRKLDEQGEKELELVEALEICRHKYIRAYPACGCSGGEQTNDRYHALLVQYQNDYEPKYQADFEKQCAVIYKSLRENVIATIHGDIKAANRHKNDINRLLRETNFSDSTYQIKIEPAKNENGQFYEMLMAKELDSKNVDVSKCEGQMDLGEDEFYKKYEQKIQLLIDKFMPPKHGEEQKFEQKRREMEQYADYRNYLSFGMFEQVTDEQGNVVRENFVDEMAGRDSGGEGQNPKYVALLAGFAMLYMQQNVRDSKIKLVLLDEAFSKMDQERSEVCLNYARKMDLQLIVCVPDERLQSLIRNVDCVYGFRRYNNQTSMMHIDKGNYMELIEGIPR